jgi:hypothetical protein
MVLTAVVPGATTIDLTVVLAPDPRVEIDVRMSVRGCGHGERITVPYLSSFELTRRRQVSGMRENLEGFRKLLQNEDVDVSDEEFETGLDLMVRGAEAFKSHDQQERERIEGLLGVTFRRDGLSVR